MEFVGAAKVWITGQVLYEPAKPDTDKRQAFDQYLSAAITRILKPEETITSMTNPYTDFAAGRHTSINSENEQVPASSKERMATPSSIPEKKTSYH